MDELKPHEARIARYPVQNWLTGRMKAAAVEQDRSDLVSLWSGQAAPLLRHRDVRSLMAALVEHPDAVAKTFAGGE